MNMANTGESSFFFLMRKPDFRVLKLDPGWSIRNRQNCCHQDYFDVLLKHSEYQHSAFRNDRVAHLPP